MKILKWIITLVIALTVLLTGVIYGASELGGEVVVLQRIEATGETTRIRVWVVDEVGSSLIEHGDASSYWICLLYTSPSPRDATLSRMPSSA